MNGSIRLYKAMLIDCSDISEFMLLQNAKKLFQSTGNELLRLISHGLLHLLGYKDNDKAKKKEMSKEEDFFIKLFHVKPS